MGPLFDFPDYEVSHSSTTVRDPIVVFLMREGPQLSTTVTAYLCSVLGISEVAARQRVSRAKFPVKRLGIITFPRKARFLYLEQQFGSPYYWKSLRAALTENNTAYGLALTALITRGGVCLEKHFPIICGSPYRQKGHLSSEVVLERLVQAGLLKRHHHDGHDLVSIAQNEGAITASTEEMYVRLMAETALIGSVQTWLKNLNLVSFNSIRTRDDDVVPMVATYAWDITGPSYLNPLLGAKRSDGVSPGFWVCDVYLGRVGGSAAKVFLHKCQTFRALRKVAPTMQMIVADHYTPVAFQLLKRGGVLAATVKTLFGAGTAEALKRAAVALGNSLQGSADVEGFTSVLRQLKEQQSELGNVRGIFFEILVRDVVKANSSGSPQAQIGFLAKNKKDDEAEVDVLVFSPGKGIRFIETKAFNPNHTLPDAEVERWLEHNIPTVFRYSQNHPEWKKEQLSFEFWSTAPLSEEALSKVDTFRTKNARRYNVVVRQKNEILSEFRETRNKKLVLILKNHFLKRP